MSIKKTSHLVTATKKLTFLLCLLAMLTALGCTGGNDGGDVIAPVDKKNCEKHSECGTGFTCEGGLCRPGECVQALQPECGPDADPVEIAPFCCKPWQLCNFARQCVADPDAPIGTQCLVSEDCPGVGQFCSGGSCYDPAGRTPCTASFQCPADERCDRTVFLCVPDLGGCTYCDVFPELCCEEGSICDAETGFCTDPNVEIECTPETVAEDCLPNQQCDELGRCVQCIDDEDCGPGTACNPATGSCYSVLNRCESDEDCDPPRLCASASSECVIPHCQVDGDCEDARERCDSSTFTCYLPPADCDETDEPNDVLDDATPMGGLNYANTLCRGNTDYLSFGIQSDKRYRATITFPDYTVGGVKFAILKSDGTTVDEDILATFENSTTIMAITDEVETGTYYLKITGSGEAADLWAYTIEVEETDAPEVVDCTEETTLGIEPNNTFGEAYAIMAGSTSFSRCDSLDVDYYYFTVPAQNGVEVTVDFDNDDGDLAIDLYSAQSTSSSVDSSDAASSDIERVEAPEGYTEFWLKVALWSSTAMGTDGQSYTITVNYLPRPSECDTDTDEPLNDSADGAGDLSVNTSTESMICVSADIDYYDFTVPADAAGELALSFSHQEGDLRLDLYDDNSMLVGSSNTSSTSSPSETVELPFASEDKTYTAVVRLNAGTGTVAQGYTLMATTYDASACTLSEPSDNNSFKSGQCVGNIQTDFPCTGPVHNSPLEPPSLSECSTATDSLSGCGTVCGASDEDWFRVGTLNDGQLLRAKLTYDPGDGGVNGRLGLALGRANTDLTSSTFVDYDPNTSNNGVVELSLNAPTVDPAFAREYGVLVRPEGSLGFSALNYSLEIEVGEGCYADDYEPNAAPIDIVSSNRLRPSGVPGDNYEEVVSASLCSFDHDVYELLAFPGETVSVYLLGHQDINLDIGLRPDDLNDAPIAAAGGAGQVVMMDCPAWWNEGNQEMQGDAGTEANTDGGVDVDAGAESDAGAGASDAGSSDSDAGSSDSDAGSSDPDAGSSDPDAGSSDPDAGSSDSDAGSSDPDAGSSDSDAGSSDPDAGSSDSDAGSSDSDAGSSDSDAGSSDSDAGSSDSDAGSSDSDAGSSDGGVGSSMDSCMRAMFVNDTTQQIYLSVSSEDNSSKGLYQLHVAVTQ
jgi:hypothetical protein